MQSGEIIAGRFALERPVGQGGMGVVYRARDLDAGGLVALKALKRLQPAAVQRFSREAELLAALSHPGIVRYVAHGADGTDEPFLVMEWLDGEDLAQRLLRGPLDVAQAVALTKRVAAALGAAHAQGVVHRDVKPHNLFLPQGRLEEVKIVDFGVARPGGELSDMTATGALLGTAGYLAPEQATLGARGLEASADVFSLGCVLYECLTGRLPFVGDNALAVLSKILLAEAPRLRDARPEAPEALERLVLDMLSKDPAARPRDGAAVVARREALDRIAPVAAVAERSPAEAPRGLTHGEQQLLCVVLLGPGASPEVDAEVGRFGGRLDALLDGSRLVTFAGLGVATDLAAQAARCALALRAARPGVPIALATGRGDATRALPVGEVIDRAFALLRDPLTVPSPGTTPRSSAPNTRRPPGIWVDEATAGLLDHRFDIGGDRSGLELQHERAHAAPRTFLGKVLPFVGRDRELAQLDAIARACADEPRAAVALVTAPPGVGKSRLRRELLERLALHEPAFEVLLASAEPLRAGSAFGLIGEAVRHAAGIRGGEPLELRHKKLRARLSRHLPAAELGSLSAFLGELAGAPVTEAPSPALQAARRDPQLMGAQLQRAFEALLRAELAAGPVLFVIEDLQWADAPTVRLLDGALSAFADQPLMLLALARPEARATFPDLWAAHGVVEIGLGPLPKRAIERFVKQALGDDTDPARVQRLADRSAGNAFYLEELCRAAAEGRDERLPDSVVAMAGARLDAMSPEDRRLLRAASVFGERFWLGGVIALGDAERPEAAWIPTRARLRALAERELITRRPDADLPGEEAYDFRHALMREAAYAALTEEDRRLGHRLAATWLADGREADPLVLAEHFERGGVLARAIAEYTRAARQAMNAASLVTPEAMLALTGRALALGAQGVERGELLALEAEHMMWSGRMDEIAARSSEAVRLLPRSHPAWYRSAGWHLTVEFMQSAPGERSTLLDELVAEPLRPEVLAAQTFTWGVLQFHLLLLGRYPDARRLQARIEEAERALADEDDPFIRGGLALSRAFVAYQLDGDPWTMRRMLLEALRGYEQVEERNLIGNIELHLAVADLLLGAYDAAEARLTELLGMGGAGAHLLVRSFLAFAHYWRGRYAEARALVEEILPSILASGVQVDIAVNQTALAQILLAQGELEAAELLVTRALTFDGASFRTLTLSVLTELRLAQGRVAEALDASEERARVIEAAGIHPMPGFTKLSTSVAALDAAGLPSAPELAALRAFILDRAARIDDPRYRASYLAAPDNAHLLALAEARLGPPDSR
ncbi:MAG: protein kinase [Deltaproteobacteria bacterium]|nr:protein kinase [Deltaproteobacteria bacterium]